MFELSRRSSGPISSAELTSEAGKPSPASWQVLCSETATPEADASATRPARHSATSALPTLLPEAGALSTASCEILSRAEAVTSPIPPSQNAHAPPALAILSDAFFRCSCGGPTSSAVEVSTSRPTICSWTSVVLALSSVLLCALLESTSLMAATLAFDTSTFCAGSSAGPAVSAGSAAAATAAEAEATVWVCTSYSLAPASTASK
mmetsp:Transcript_89935/g.290516  ORF Transcript_89935/g.290516 Transcript_89935/m.290516 type:complete len:206 (+) Transcript_89935:2615-3232(+)